MFEKSAGVSGYARLAIRKRVQVFPDFGNERMKTSSGKDGQVATRVVQTERL